MVNEISKETGDTFLPGTGITGNISIISNTPASPAEAYQMFLASLESLGYAVRPDPAKANTFDIVHNTDAAGMPVDASATGNQVVVRAIPVQNASQLAPIVKPLLPQWAMVQAYTPDNVLIISAPAADIQNIATLIQSMDNAAGNNIDVIPLKNATATDLANVLNQMENSNRAAGGASSVSIEADPRSNSIILSGDQIDRIKVAALINKLDTPTMSGGQTQVVFLKYLSAKTFAPTLALIAKGSDTTNNPLANAVYTTANSPSVQAVADENALILTGSPEKIMSLKNLISTLDVRPAQVLIEAAIVEIDESEAHNLGVEWGTVTGGTDDSAGLAGSASTSDGLQNAFTSGVGIIKHGNFQMLVHALSTSSAANILSTPSIVVLNNHEANIDVGKQINVQSEAQSSAGAISNDVANSTITSTFKQQQVALMLDVKPQVYPQGNTVELQIKQKDDALQNPNDTSTNPIINISGMTTDVDVQSKDILVLGGLIKNQLSDSEDSVPILSKIPLLGNAFKYKTHSVEKKYLMVFIHPVILNNADDDSTVSNAKYDYIRKVQLAWQGGSEASTSRLLAPRAAKPPVGLPAPFSSDTSKQ